MDDVLDALARVIEQRKGADPASSYTARLLAGGQDGILKKVGEEAVELVLAAKNGAPDQIVHEAADLWYHTLVLLAACDLEPKAVARELERRFAQSGLVEKAGRGSR